MMNAGRVRHPTWQVHADTEASEEYSVNASSRPELEKRVTTLEGKMSHVVTELEELKTVILSESEQEDKSGSPERDPDRPTCHSCNEVGHIKTECPNQHKSVRFHETVDSLNDQGLREKASLHPKQN